MSARSFSVAVGALVVLVAITAAANAAKVLYFREASIAPDRVERALIFLGHDVTLTGSSTDFAAQLATDGYQLGICFIQQRGAAEYASAVRALSSFVAAGGRALYADWSRDATLAAEFGAGFTGRGDQRQVTLLGLESGGTPAPDSVKLRNTGWFSATSGLTSLPGSSVAARFENGDAAIVRGGSGRSLMFGFLNDTPVTAGVFARAIEAVLGASGAPIIAPPIARGLVVHAATISATVAANNLPTEVLVEYGLTTSYGQRTTLRRIGAGPGVLALRERLTGLAAHTQYHYRVRAKNRAGTTQTGDLTFTTLDTAPIARGDVVVPLMPGAFTIQPLINDRDPDGDPLQISAVTPGQFGTVTFDGSTVTYTPAAADVLRADAFTYTVTDSFGGSITSNVRVLLRVGLFYSDYAQLITGPAGIAGRLNLTLNRRGAFTGRLFFEGGNYLLAGAFRPDGRVRIARHRAGASDLVLTLELMLAGGTPRIVGTIEDGTGPRPIDAGAVRTTALPDMARAGRYTLVVPEAQLTGVPRGEAWAIFSGNSAGRLRLVGRFADGAPFAGATFLQPDGSAPVYLLRRAPVVETLAGTLQFSGAGGAQVDGPLTWQRSASAGSAAFTATSQATGARFNPPPPRVAIFQFSNSAVPRATATFTADEPGFPLDRTVAIGLQQLRVFAPPVENFHLGLSRSTGLCLGNFRHATLGPCRIGGVLLQSENVVRGNFSGAGKSGVFRLTPL
jgi:hypothetical protein